MKDRNDHTLPSDTAHGYRGGGPLHSVATSGMAGFMSTSDKIIFDAITAPWGGASPALLTLYGNPTGVGDYNCLTLHGEGTANNSSKGGLISGSRYANANEPFTVIGFYDQSTSRDVYVGGGGWGLPGSNWIGLYTAPTYTETNDTDVLRFEIDTNGNTRNVSSGGLGYGTGSGGAQTQGTSRVTGVTLDKTNGAITLFSAAGSATYQTFTVTNNKVAATDTIIVNQKSGTDLYEIHVTAVTAGSFNITFRTTGGTTSEQPVFNFAVIKAVTS